jgi:hypothetical protein
VSIPYSEKQISHVVCGQSRFIRENKAIKPTVSLADLADNKWTEMVKNITVENYGVELTDGQILEFISQEFPDNKYSINLIGDKLLKYLGLHRSQQVFPTVYPIDHWPCDKDTVLYKEEFKISLRRVAKFKNIDLSSKWQVCRKQFRIPYIPVYFYKDGVDRAFNYVDFSIFISETHDVHLTESQVKEFMEQYKRELITDRDISKALLKYLKMHTFVATGWPADKMDKNYQTNFVRQLRLVTSSNKVALGGKWNDSNKAKEFAERDKERIKEFARVNFDIHLTDEQALDEQALNAKNHNVMGDRSRISGWIAKTINFDILGMTTKLLNKDIALGGLLRKNGIRLGNSWPASSEESIYVNDEYANRVREVAAKDYDIYLNDEQMADYLKKHPCQTGTSMTWVIGWVGLPYHVLSKKTLEAKRHLAQRGIKMGKSWDKV